ncbi:recombinase family protein [Streptomyces sp. NBC_01092]|uniref:recombinase family protein n=1 Tax=Streptomyces sp. NBC_01092 TaxID=2903748 RepID=UPI0038651A8A|nr:recombinase family protein [Streptomyces sp. NBC_01092]
MATAVATRTAREYARSSKGKGGRSRSTDDQHKDNLKAERNHGPWTWGQPYADTGSASKFATKARGDFAQLLADLRSGAFGQPGDVLVLWEISRLTRETGQGSEIIRLCEAHGYLIHVTVAEHTYNPANVDDWAALMGGVVKAEEEARRLSARTLRGVNSAVDDGRPHGKIPFGYCRTYELIDGRPRPVSQEPDPVQGPLVVELFERVAGWNGRKRDSIRAVALNWEERGIVSRQSDKPISAANMRPLLINKAYIGIRVHKGSERPGNWPALVDRELFNAVQRLLADPSRKSVTSSAVKHVLTGTLRCDVCGNGMTITPGDRPKKQGAGHHGHAAYVCRKYGCLRIDKTAADDYLINELLTYLFLAPREEVPAQLAEDDSHSELSSVRAELIRLRGELDELEAAPAPRNARARIQRTNDMDELETEIATLERREADLTAPDPLDGLFETGPGAADRWVASDITVQRAVAALVFAPHGPLGQPRVRRVADSASPAARDRIRRYKAEGAAV